MTEISPLATIMVAGGFGERIRVAKLHKSFDRVVFKTTFKFNDQKYAELQKSGSFLTLLHFNKDAADEMGVIMTSGFDGEDSDDGDDLPMAEEEEEAAELVDSVLLTKTAQKKMQSVDHVVFAVFLGKTTAAPLRNIEEYKTTCFVTATEYAEAVEVDSMADLLKAAEAARKKESEAAKLKKVPANMVEAKQRGGKEVIESILAGAPTVFYNVKEDRKKAIGNLISQQKPPQQAGQQRDHLALAALLSGGKRESANP